MVDILDETLLDIPSNKSMCQTCEENEAINEYYGECQECIEVWEGKETYRLMMEDRD